MGFKHTGAFPFDSDKLLRRPFQSSYEDVDAVVTVEDLKRMMKDMRRQRCFGVARS